MYQSNVSTKDLIQETALDLFKENGYENVTVMEICQACKITKRTFYYHFDCKADLLTGIIDYWGIKAERLMSTFVNEKRIIDILWQIMRVYCVHSQKYGPSIMKQVYILMLENGKDVRFPFKMYLYDLAVQLLKKAQDAGEILNMGDPSDIAFILYHSFRSISISWASENGSYNLIDEFKKSFDIIVGYPYSAEK